MCCHVKLRPASSSSSPTCFLATSAVSLQKWLWWVAALAMVATAGVVAYKKRGGGSSSSSAVGPSDGAPYANQGSRGSGGAGTGGRSRSMSQPSGRSSRRGGGGGGGGGRKDSDGLPSAGLWPADSMYADASGPGGVSSAAGGAVERTSRVATRDSQELRSSGRFGDENGPMQRGGSSASKQVRRCAAVARAPPHASLLAHTVHTSMGASPHCYKRQTRLDDSLC
jgi:hypothetical protein